MGAFQSISLILIPIGALLVLVTGLAALRAWLSLRRTRLTVREELSTNIGRLANRTGEVEERIRTLDTRAGVLPVHLHEIQRSLTTLKILTKTLATSANQAHKALSRDPATSSTETDDSPNENLLQAPKAEPER